MEQQWHRNPKTGKIGRCGATKRPCRFGPANHFSSEEQALAHEAVSQGGVVPSPVKKKNAQKSSKVRKPDSIRMLNTPEEREAFKAELSQLACQE